MEAKLDMDAITADDLVKAPEVKNRKTGYAKSNERDEREKCRIYS